MDFVLPTYVHNEKFVSIYINYTTKKCVYLYLYKEMGVHKLDAVIRDWLEDPPPQHPAFPLRALEEEL
jgi:hypothetical protein